MTYVSLAWLGKVNPCMPIPDCIFLEKYLAFKGETLLLSKSATLPPILYTVLILRI